MPPPFLPLWNATLLSLAFPSSTSLSLSLTLAILYFALVKNFSMVISSISIIELFHLTSLSFYVFFRCLFNICIDSLPRINIPVYLLGILQLLLSLIFRDVMEPLQDKSRNVQNAHIDAYACARRKRRCATKRKVKTAKMRLGGVEEEGGERSGRTRKKT